MHTGQWRRSRSRREGQALLVAVLLMTVILLTGILFTALVAYNQQQSARSVDVNTAQALAEAGVRWCNENLINSPQGADWRPPFRAFDPATYDETDRDTWPVPPVMDTNSDAYGVYGPDAVSNTEQDYYKDFQLARGWHGLVDAITGEYIRYGFYRIPDLNSTPSAVLLPTEAGQIAGKGHILVRVTYDPDPPYEHADWRDLGSPHQARPDGMSAAIKIESIGVVDDDIPVFRYLVAYKPIGLTDYLLFVTDREGTGRTTTLGFNPNLDMDNTGNLDWLGQYFYGPLKFNTGLELRGDNRDGTLGGSGTKIALTPEPTQAVLEVPGIAPLVTGGGYLRQDRVEVAGGIVEPVPSTDPPLNSAAVFLRETDGVVTPAGQVTTDGDTLGGLVMDGRPGTDAQGHPRTVRPLTAPEAFAGSGADRYRALTRDSGEVHLLANGTSVNMGALGQGAGVYVDNRDDIQFSRGDGSSDLKALMNEWMKVFPAGQHSAQDSGWNETYTVYTPPGVEITLFPTETASLNFGQLDWSLTPPNEPGVVWWPNHTEGEPGIRLVRHDRNWVWRNPVTNLLEDSGESVMYVDYPDYPNQVLMAEGNTRVRGVLPQRDANSRIYSHNDLSLCRDYNLTLVSGATIYIDGQILSPQDVYGRDPGSGTLPSVGASLPDEYSTKLALLARDSVVLNATRIVPQLTSGMVAAEPDDPFNPRFDEQHWVLSPEVAGSAYSSWTFGERLNPGHGVSLAVQHTAVDPGPAAVQLSIFDGRTMSWNRYNFGGIWDPFKFYFLQPGLVSPPSPNVETALTPDWSEPFSPADPAVPWQVRPLLDDPAGYPEPGVLKSLALNPVDPGIAGVGGGPTEYWLKKWKLVETTDPGEPTGAVHAKVNALIYAETGSWFVIPGDYFDPRQTGTLARAFRRYNYDICVRGAITENFRADAEMVREWSDKWAWPVPGGGWATIRYEFDESLRDTRDPRDMRVTILSNATRYADPGSPKLPGLVHLTATPRGNLPRVPLLPVSKDLIFYGEGH